MEGSDQDRGLNLSRSVAKALAILEFVGLNGESGLAQIAAATKLPKSTLHRLINTLVEEGFLRRTAYGQYRVTVKLWRIGASAVDYEAVRESARDVLEGLVRATSETAHYAVYEGGWAVYVEKIDGVHPIRAYTTVGGRSPAYASATGKALLAWRGANEIAHVGESAERFTSATHVGAEPLLTHAEAIRQAGVAINRGEWRADVWGVGAPVFGPAGDVVAAIGVSGPAARVETNLERYVAAVREAAQRLSSLDGPIGHAAERRG